MKVQSSNGSEKTSIVGSLYQVEDTQVEVPEMVTEETIGRTDAKTQVEILATKEPEEYIDVVADMDNFELNFNFDPD